MIIKINEEIGYWGISANRIKRQLDDASGDITVEINSPGGSVVEGISIFNALKAYNKGKIEVVINGMAASMASYIALAGDTIKAYDNAIFMIHNAWGVAIGDYREMNNRSKVLSGMNNILKKAYIDQTAKSDKDIKSLMDNETYFFGEEILDNGFVDEIITTDKEKNQNSALAIASETFKSCINNVRANEKNEDFEEMVALINQEEEHDTENTENGKNEKECYNNGEQTKPREREMTKAEFKAQHPAIFAEVFNDGVAQEQDRVNAHVQMAKSTGANDFALECIEKGEGLSQVAQARYMTHGMNNQQKQEREDENLEDVDTSNEDDASKKVDEVDEALASRLGVNLKNVKKDN